MTWLEHLEVYLEGTRFLSYPDSGMRLSGSSPAQAGEKTEENQKQSEKFRRTLMLLELGPARATGK